MRLSRAPLSPQGAQQLPGARDQSQASDLWVGFLQRVPVICLCSFSPPLVGLDPRRILVGESAPKPPEMGLFY